MSEYGPAHQAAAKQFHLVLEVGWKTLAKQWPEGFGEGTKAALVLMLGFAMKRLCAVGFETKDIVGIWESVRSQPDTLALQEAVAAEVAKLPQKEGGS